MSGEQFRPIEAPYMKMYQAQFEKPVAKVKVVTKRRRKAKKRAKK